jgi:SAM-dependent methyltransferase
MTLESVMGMVGQWGTTTEALAAVGAELAVQQPGVKAPAEIVDGLKAVSTAAGITDLSELAPPQQAMLLGIIRLFLHQALELLEHPDREPGWTVTDPAILDGFGRGSAMIPALIASAHPDLATVTSFLDVGTGVGLLAVAAANVWPNATVVGIDPWEPALERARPNIAQAGLEDRITLRRQDLAAFNDVDTYDCAWIPTFFLTEPVLEAGLATVMRALRPGGWVVLGRNRSTQDPLAAAIAALRWTRGGGGSLDDKVAVDLLEAAGCDEVHHVPPAGPVPIELILGRRPPA